MRTSIATIGLVFGIASAAAAQLAPLNVGGAPPPVDGLAAAGTPADTGTRSATRDADATPRRCQEGARAFLARNTRSPSRRQQALEACLAAAERRERVDVAGP